MKMRSLNSRKNKNSLNKKAHLGRLRKPSLM